jgi:hypothetical protein
VVDTRAAVVVDADGGKNSSQSSVLSYAKGRSDAALFICCGIVEGQELHSNTSDSYTSERQALEDGFWNVPHAGHDVAPDFWSVENIGRAAFESVDDLATNLMGVGKTRCAGQMISHGRLHRSRLDGDDADAGGMKAAAESLKK